MSGLFVLLALLVQQPRVKPGWIWVDGPVRPWTSPYFGSAVAAVGDVDADGVRDMLVADIEPPHEERKQRTFERHGMAWVLSGRDGRMLARIGAPYGADQNGIACAELGDIDGDGGGDYVLGWYEGLAGRKGFAEVRSGRTGERLLFLHGSAACARFVADAGDVDGDGRNDVLLAGERSVPGDPGAPWATIFSSVTGGVLRRIDAEPNAGRLAANPIAIGDVDGDGRSEIAMLTREGRAGCVLLSVLAGSDGRVVRRFDLEYGGRDDHWPFRGRYSLALAPAARSGSTPRVLVASATSEARIVSTRDGTVYWQHEREKNVYLGSGVVCPGDLDGDDIEDLWVGVDDNDEQGGGCVYARSGRDDHVLYTFGDDFDLDQTREAWRVGTSVAAVGDIDGDGVCDGLVGTDHTLSQSRGMAFAFSGKTGNLIFRFTREEDDVHTWLPAAAKPQDLRR
jgi:hypothetical protein